jgi:hypothetical protein
MLRNMPPYKHPRAILQILLFPNPITTLLIVMAKKSTPLTEERNLLILHCKSLPL